MKHSKLSLALGLGLSLAFAATSVVAIFSAGAYGWLRRWIGVHGFLAIDAICMGAGIILISAASATTRTSTPV